jgi:uncharacterized protein GlcG (DUF336 family)
MKTAFSIAIVLIASPALAQTPNGEHLPHSDTIGGPSLALSLEAANAAIAACAAQSYRVGATVVDANGFVRVSLAPDGAAHFVASASRRKAILSAEEKASGAELEDRVKTDKALAARVKADHDLLARGGSLLIKVGDRVVGAIDVEGDPYDIAKDVACAQAGIDKIRSRLK